MSVSRIQTRAIVIVAALVTTFSLLLPALPARASAGQAASLVTTSDGMKVPAGHTDDASTAVIACFAELTEPFLGPGLQVFTHVNVFCERPIFMIYAEVIIFWDGVPYEPSRNTGQLFGGDNLNVVSRGAPCNTGSIYQAFAYVEVWNDGGGDNAEIVSETFLRC